MMLEKFSFLICFSMISSFQLAATPVELPSVDGIKMYVKEYYDNGNLKAEGWEMGTVKMGYWIFYHSNGKLAAKGHFEANKRNGYWYFYSEDELPKKEGHYVKGSAENWWIFHDIANQHTSKIQFRNNRKDGYALLYIKKRLKKAEKYTNGVKIGEWTSLATFRRDNPNVSF